MKVKPKIILAVVRDIRDIYTMGKYTCWPNFKKMSKLLLIGIIILMISCKAKQIGIITPSLRPQYEKIIPVSSHYEIVDSFFETWLKRSKPIDSTEFNQLDTLSQLGYIEYESLISDTSFIGINPKCIESKYILIPNSFYIGYANNYREKYGIVFYDSTESIVIKDFRPRIHFENKQVLYYTKEYQNTLPTFAEKYGVGGFIDIDKYAYLMSNFPRYYETTPLIRGLIKIKNTNEFCIDYDYHDRSYETVIKQENGKWIRVKDLTIVAHD